MIVFVLLFLTEPPATPCAPDRESTESTVVRRQRPESSFEANQLSESELEPARVTI